MPEQWWISIRLCYEKIIRRKQTLKQKLQVLAWLSCQFSVGVYWEEGPYSMIRSGIEIVELDSSGINDFIFSRIGDMVICLLHSLIVVLNTLMWLQCKCRAITIWADSIAITTMTALIIRTQTTPLDVRLQYTALFLPYPSSLYVPTALFTPSSYMSAWSHMSCLQQDSLHPCPVCWL